MDDVDKLARRSKLLYKNNVQQCHTHTAQLKKETEFLEKWHGVSEREIERQEYQVRKRLDKYQKDKDKYKSDQEKDQGSTSSIARSSTHKKLSPRDEREHSPKPPRSTRRNSLDPSPKSIAQLKRESASNLAQAPRTDTPTKLKIKCKKESAQAQENTIAFLKGERRQRRASLPAICTSHFKQQHNDVFSTSKSAVPMVIVTDEEGMSTVAISDETRRQQEEQIEKTHSKPPVDRGRRRSTGNPPPTASEIDNLYATAMATASNRDEIYRSNSRSSVRSVRKHDSQVTNPDSNIIDLARLKEIEELLKETSQYRKKHKNTPVNTHASRQQQRRLERLKDILDTLKKAPKQSPTFKPIEMLNCSYLRLSQSNVEELEEMVRAAGQDPGLHYHSDLSGYDLFSELRREAEEALQKEEEEETLVSVSQFSAKPPTPKRRASLCK